MKGGEWGVEKREWKWRGKKTFPKLGRSLGVMEPRETRLEGGRVGGNKERREGRGNYDSFKRGDKV